MYAHSLIEAFSQKGIKRWTDGFLWSPSRILGNFLVYRELENREHIKIDNVYSNSSTTTSKATDETNLSLMHQKERALVGSLTTLNTTYNFKKDGLIKKTIRIMVNGTFLHIVNYYSKHDALNNLLPTPSASPELACLQISADLMPHLQGHNASFPPRDTTVNRKRSKSSDELNYHQQIYSDNSDSSKTYRINYSNFMYSTTTTTTTSSGSSSSNSSTATYPIYDNLYDRPSTSISPGLTTSVFDTYNYQHGNKRSRTSQDTLSPSLSPTPSPPIILSTSTSCGDTAILANRFNQFYNPTNTNISNRNPINNNSTSTFDFTQPRRTTAFDNY